MTPSEVYLLALPVAGYGAVAIVAALAAWSAVRRHPKRTQSSAFTAHGRDADIERALDNLSHAIAERKRSASS